MKKFAILLSIIAAMLVSDKLVAQSGLRLGADKMDELLPLVEGKRVALVINQTSIQSHGTHLLDALLAKNVKVVKIFAPEHGFRGEEDAGALIVDGKDKKTGIEVVSLYGKNYKPSNKQLADVDVVVFDIQDVGTRFYTYISTMHYVMEACAQNRKKMVVLDRPNPNDYIDGPVLDMKFKSFVGMHPIPVLHGLTIGELAKMINGEQWLANGAQCNVQIIVMDGWKHTQPYALPVAPSPNLPNMQAVKLYPSLCFFEATSVSVGRGTVAPFQVIGAPDNKFGGFGFTPKSIKGATNPLQLGRKCYGVDLREFDFAGGLSLAFFLDFYRLSEAKGQFFTNPRFMDLLSGTDQLRKDIVAGKTEEEIRSRWTEDLDRYIAMRGKYLLYE